MIAQWVKDHRKFIVAVIAAVAVAVQSKLTDGTITNDEWVAIGLAALGALGVTTVRNGDKPAEDASLRRDGDVH